VGDTLKDSACLRSAITIMDERLERRQAGALVVAISGGADSLFLLLAARAWARAAGRRLAAVTVDHGLQPQSTQWALWCHDRARRLGIDHTTLAWEGPKPLAGLPAAARAARHRLVAEHARSIGAAVVLMGHTADDAIEAGVMRANGGSTSEAREWAPSPVWPEGRGVFILRPLVCARRGDLRLTLAAEAEEWIEDPFNSDLRFARSRARAFVQDGAAAWAAAERKQDDRGAAIALAAVRGEETGALQISRERLRQENGDPIRKVVAAATVSVSGSPRPPRRARMNRLLDALRGADEFVATLAGARIEADESRIVLMREPGELGRIAPELGFALPRGQAVTWDGRFEIEARAEGLSVRPLAGASGRLSPAERQRLARYSPTVRRTLPAIVDRDGGLTCPILACEQRVSLGRLVFARLAAACGAARDEAALRRMAEANAAS
jgi:tRNA(Ile)-lysidine synthase